MIDAIEFLGSAGSPYTRKMIALMRYRRIPYSIHWSSGKVPPGYPTPKIRLLPTFFLPDDNGELSAVTDSTPIIRRLEGMHENRSVIPDNPVLGFINDLIEDYADEWLTKAMFHFRWAHEPDYMNAGPLLAHWDQPLLTDDEITAYSDQFTKHQINRLYVVGSNAVTAPVIEASYVRLIKILSQCLSVKGYVLGARPSSADFAIYGQLTQLAIVEPTSAKITRRISSRVRAWIDRMEDLSGHDTQQRQWYSLNEVRQNLRPLLSEIGRTYVPVMLANENAVLNQKDEFETLIDEAKWTQPTFRYQAKCLGWIKETYQNLSNKNRDDVDEILIGTGCDSLFSKSYTPEELR